MVSISFSDARHMVTRYDVPALFGLPVGWSLDDFWYVLPAMIEIDKPGVAYWSESSHRVHL